jgi:glucan phosphoethanolaminetransferase (alkaline phosphatase superfamily)
MLFLYMKSHPGASDFLPSIYRLTGNLLFANGSRPEVHWRRAAVTQIPGARKAAHIFVVVDESITGTALSVNGFPAATSPFLQAHAKEFINFGIATSFTNYSAGSNLAMLSGMLPGELPDAKYVSFSKPSIFQYARQAGYQTYLLDAQAGSNKLQNYTTPHDLSFIDSVFRPGVTCPSVTLYDRDSVLAEAIAAIAKTEAPTFAYINKVGAHWPYESNFSPGALRNHFTAPGYSHEKNVVPYFKSLYWNVDRFWKLLFEKLQHERDVLILYTADHGENYASESFRMKHASIYKAPVVEGLVPLLVYDRAQLFPKGFVLQRDRYSHQYIFPTLLYAMGYKSDFIHGRYGRSLLEPPYPQPRWFLTGDLFGRGKANRILVDK